MNYLQLCGHVVMAATEHQKNAQEFKGILCTLSTSVPREAEETTFKENNHVKIRVCTVLLHRDKELLRSVGPSHKGFELKSFKINKSP